MKKSEVNEEITLTNKLIQINKDKIKVLEEKENTIQERYKKMMDDELAGIIREKTERLSAIETLEKMLSKDDASVVDTKDEEKPVEVVEQPTPEPEQKTEEKQEDKKEEEPVIQDTLFPENNEPEIENGSESEATSEEQNATNNEESTGQSTSGEEQVENEVIADDTSAFDFGNNQQPESSTENENWPSMPEEWQ